MLALLCLCLAADLAPDEAIKSLGRRATVRFTLRATGDNGDFLEGYSQPRWNIGGCFFLRIPKEKRMLIFRKLGIKSMTELVGAELLVTGTVEKLDFGTEGSYAVIVVDRARSIELVARPKPAYTATKEYTVRTISGFTVYLHPDALAAKTELTAALKEFSRQADELPKYLPEERLKPLRKVPIWIEHRQKGAMSAAAFHVSEDWLRGNGYNPDKAGAVEISNTKFFVEWSVQQPYMLLHELAHAYHNRELGANHAGIKTAYKQAIDRKLYERVRHVDGRTEKAYAAYNDQEYFAELTEAYFGKNDFFPFNRAELRKHDRAGYDLMEKLWGKPLR
jgi:hypothetical protein